MDDDGQMTALFGPLAPYSDHKRGETISFMLRGSRVSGEVTWITAAGPSPTGQHHSPVTYVCYVEGELMPTLVYQTEVIEE